MLLSISRHQLTAFFCLLTTLAFAQRLPTAPTELTFGGVTVYLNAPAQQRLQQEMTSLYADRTALRNAIEQMQYVESVLGPMLEERSVPADFRYLCLSANPANGAYWGLDVAKAISLNLKVDTNVDERLNVASSSEAVLDDLAGLYQKQPNWVRVLQIYANGQRLGQTAEAASSGQPIQLAADNPVLVWATLARKLVFEREPPLVRSSEPILLYDYRQGRGKSLSAIARELGIDQNRFIPFNDWLRVRVIPTDKGYPVLIRLTSAEFLTVRGQVNASTQSPQQTSPSSGIRRDMGFPVLRKLPISASNDPLIRAAQFYEINDRRGVQAQPCDNMITMAYYGDISVRKFMQMNDMTERDLVRPGEIYYLEPKARKARIPLHVVQPGQTLRDVSTMFGVRLKSLLSYNHLEPNNRVQTGRILWLREKRPSNVPIEYQITPNVLPEPEPTVAQRKLSREDEESSIDSPSLPNWRFPAKDTVRSVVSQNQSQSVSVSAPPISDEPEAGVASNAVYYTVREGDTHSGVAQRYNILLTDLMTWNKLSYRKPLVAGQQLIVALATAAKPAAAAVVATPKPTAPIAATVTTTMTPPQPTSENRTREYAESVVDVEVPATPPVRVPVTRTAPPVKKPDRLVNQVRVETPKVNGRSYYHVVQPGQTVYRVALINKVSVDNVMKWNNLVDYTIEIGQRILIKK